MAYELLRSGNEDLRVIVSNEAVRVFTTSANGNCAIVVKVHLGLVVFGCFNGQGD